MDIKEQFNKRLCREIAAEFLGTLLFLICVVSITFSWGIPTQDVHSEYLKIAVGLGLAIATLAYAFGHISGGHLNPAVSIGMLIARRLHIVKCVLYVIAQVAGGLLGTVITYGCLPTREAVNGMGGYQITVTGLHKDVTPAQGFGLELLFTFILVFFILSTTDSAKESLPCNAALGIGVAVVACHACLIPFTGCSINPARSFGPAVVTNVWTDHWVYWVGPVLGAVLASLIYNFLFFVDIEKRYAEESDETPKQVMSNGNVEHSC